MRWYNWIWVSLVWYLVIGYMSAYFTSRYKMEFRAQRGWERPTLGSDDDRKDVWLDLFLWLPLALGFLGGALWRVANPWNMAARRDYKVDQAQGKLMHPEGSSSENETTITSADTWVTTQVLRTARPYNVMDRFTTATTNANQEKS